MQGRARPCELKGSPSGERLPQRTSACEIIAWESAISLAMGASSISAINSTTPQLIFVTRHPADFSFKVVVWSTILTGPEKGSRNRGTHKRRRLADVSVTVCAVTFCSNFLNKWLHKRSQTGYGQVIRCTKGCENVTTNMVTFSH